MHGAGRCAFLLYLSGATGEDIVKFLLSLFTHRNRRVRQLRVRIALLLSALLTPAQLLRISGLPATAGGETTLNELIEKRQNIIKQMNEVNDAALAEGRDLTAEEEANHTKAFEEQEKIERQIKRVEESRELARKAAEDAAKAAEQRKAGAGGDNPSGGGGEQRSGIDLEVEKRALEARKWLSQSEPTTGTRQFRALQADNDAEGGNLVRPEQFVTNLIKAVDNEVFIRQLATVFQVTDAESLGAPSLDTDAADADWTSELATGEEDTGIRFGKRSLTPHPLAKRIKISKTLLRKAALSAESIVTSRLAYKFGVTQEKAFLTGSGALQPLGVFTASPDGISTGRDVSTGNTTTSITFDGLMEALYTLKAAYWPRANWVFHRDAIKQIAKLKDGDGRYLWEPSVQMGQPDRIKGLPVRPSEYAPNTFTTGLYVGIIGDFSQYWIADSLAFDLTRLVELYAATNQIGFIGRAEVDGMPVLEEAFVRVKLA